MKKLFLIALILIMNACTKEEIKLEAFSPEAFAYDLGEKWEINALVNVKGFEQREYNGNTFEASINLSADIKTPGGMVLEGVYADTLKVANHEEISDIPLEVQFELDTTYSTGEYLIIIHITDELSKNSITTNVEVELSE